MIYLLDQPLTNKSHSKFIIDVINNHTDTEIKLIEMPKDPTFGQINKIVVELMALVTPSDIVLCPWAVTANEVIDDLFNKLATLCWTVVSAGNYNQDVNLWSPARAENVITVACLNKSGLKASLSNWSDEKELIWVPGTNYTLSWKNTSGTSVSAAIYAAFLSEALKNNDPKLLDELLNNYSKALLDSLNNIQH